jgi:hypothetical protein
MCRFDERNPLSSTYESEIGKKTASYEAPAGRFCGVDGRQFGRELAGFMESMGASSGGSLGIRVLLLFGNFFLISFLNER